MTKSSVTPLSLIGQVVFYGLFALIIGYFSTQPSYRHMAPDRALIKLSFSHQAQLVADCRKRTPEELAKLPPNMRAPMECARERSPVKVQLSLDGTPLYDGVAQPSGLSRDGASTLYRRFEIPAGEHKLAVKMNDNVRLADFNYVKEEKVTLKPAQILVVDFSAERGGIIFVQ